MENLASKAQQLKPTVWIGKNGIDEKLIDEIKKQLKTRKLVKIKILKGAIDECNVDRKAVPKEIAKKVDAELVLSVGFVFTLYREE